MLAVLFDEIKIEIDPVSSRIGGSWQGRDSKGRVCSYDPQLLKFFFSQLRPGDFYADVGSNTGSYSLLCTQLDVRCVAFEPNPEIVPILRANLCLNNCDKVTVEEISLADFNGDSTLYIPPIGESGLACIHKTPRFSSHHEVGIKTRTFDSYQFENIKQIKIDVEGAELLVLKGAENTLRRLHPSLLVEYDERNTVAFDYRREEIEAFLRSLGYTSFKRMGESGRDLWVT